MPLVKEIEFNNGLLVLWEISEDLETLLGLCSGIRLEDEFDQLKNTRRKKEWLAIRLILKHSGCSDTSISYNDINQPMINHSKYQHISISHSKKLAGVLFHKSKPAGLDIESTDRDLKKIAHKYMSNDELKIASTLDNGLTLFWCIKEAIYKVAGVPGIHFSTQIKVTKIARPNIFAKFHSKERIKDYKLNFLSYKDQLITYVIDHEQSSKKSKSE